MSARIPTLAPFAALVRRPVPDVKDIALDARLAEASGGFAKGMVLTQTTLNLPQGDISGDASVTFTRPPSITGNVTSKRIIRSAARVEVGQSAGAPGSGGAASCDGFGHTHATAEAARQSGSAVFRRPA